MPVVDGTAPPVAPSAQPTPAQGAATLAATRPDAAVKRQVDDLYDLVEGTSASTTSGGGGETITFPSDVLFDFDSAALSGKAQQVIAQAATDLQNRTAPGRPVTIEGHTDGKGLPPRNQPLSEQRATAARDALLRNLAGKSYDFQVSGKANNEPAAKETTDEGTDPAGRGRNRRVEIAYTLRRAPETPQAGGLRSGEAGSPASFRNGNGAVVGERTATVDTAYGQHGERLRLRVYPFYQDGAYMTAVFELINLGGSALNRPPGFRGYLRANDFKGGDFGTFRATAPDGTVYRAVRVGIPADYSTGVYLSGSIIVPQPNVPGQTYMYVPAPPRTVKSITLDAGPFGKVSNVPIQ